MPTAETARQGPGLIACESIPYTHKISSSLHGLSRGKGEVQWRSERLPMTMTINVFDLKSSMRLFLLPFTPRSTAIKFIESSSYRQHTTRNCDTSATTKNLAPCHYQIHTLTTISAWNYSNASVPVHINMRLNIIQTSEP